MVALWLKCCKIWEKVRDTVRWHQGGWWVCFGVQSSKTWAKSPGKGHVQFGQGRDEKNIMRVRWRIRKEVTWILCYHQGVACVHNLPTPDSSWSINITVWSYHLGLEFQILWGFGKRAGKERSAILSLWISIFRMKSCVACSKVIKKNIPPNIMVVILFTIFCLENQFAKELD